MAYKGGAAFNAAPCKMTSVINLTMLILRARRLRSHQCTPRLIVSGILHLA